ncbi:MAG: hypothetical protein HDR85_09660 [Bacteroides sp.]|nr:hypothetical protein [Bacteroides sp.]
MGTIKFGNIEGDPKDINEFLNVTGVNKESLFDLPSNKTISPYWFTLVIIIFVICLIIILLSENKSWHTLSFFIGLVDTIVGSVFTYHKCKSSVPVLFVAIGAIVILSLALGFITIDEVRGIGYKYINHQIEQPN